MSNRKGVQNFYVLWEYFQRENKTEVPRKEGCLNGHLQLLFLLLKPACSACAVLKQNFAQLCCEPYCGTKPAES